MKNRNKLLLGIFLSLFLISLVSAANTATLQSPSASATVSGSYVLNATLDSSTLNISQAVFYFTKDGVNTTIATVTNDSIGDLMFNTTWASTGIIDADGLTFWVNMSNATDTGITFDSSASVRVDNGFPTVSLNSTNFADNLALISTTSFSVAMTADNSIGVGSCKIYFVNNVDKSIITSSPTASANTCSLTSTPSTLSLAINQDYTVYLQATDGNGNSTNSSARTIRVTPASGGGSGGVSQSIIPGETQAPGAGIGAIGAFFSSLFQRIGDFFRNIFK